MNIGVFDSGIGGKLIAQKIQTALPQVTVIFKVDTQYFPYGNKPKSIISKRLVHFANLFQKQDCQRIVIACNSATTNAISRLRQQFPRLAFIGVEPPVKPIVKLTKTGKVAIIGTTATIKSERHDLLKQQFSQNVIIYSLACPGLAEAIEANPNPRLATAQLLHQFLDQPIASGVDVVGLACTHYPYLLGQLHQLFPRVTFYDPADAVVRQVVKLTHDSMGEI